MILRSVKSIVIAPAKTGRERRRRIVVINTDHTNKDIFSKVNPSERILIIVEMKFTAPRIDLTPAKCKEKIVKSTDGPAWAIEADKGG